MNAGHTGALLKVIKGRRTGESFPLPPNGRLVIGRDTACDVQLLESGISRNHFEIVSRGSGFLLRDLGSTNGTFVNGEKVREWLLSFGDLVHLGDVKLLFDREESGDISHHEREDTEPLEISSAFRRRFETDVTGVMRLSVLQAPKPQPFRLAQHLDAIYRVSMLVNSSEDLGEILARLVETVSDVFGSRRSYIVLTEDLGIASDNVVFRGGLDNILTRQCNISTNIVDETLRDGKSVLSADAIEDERFSSRASVVLQGIRSVMSVPIEAHGEVLGAVYVDSASRPAAYAREDLELLAAVGRLAGVAVHRAYLISKRGEAEKALEEQEEEIRQLQKLEAVGRLAGGVAHDFNNLLGVVTGYCDLALAELAEEDPMFETMAEIREAASRATDLTRQLLAFSRKQLLELRIMDLNVLVVGAEKMLGRLIGEDIELRTSLEPRLGMIKADPGQVQQIIMNLALNARDAMPQGGTLLIETQPLVIDEDFVTTHPGFKPGSYAVLAVTDTGTGMDRETRAHIFEPFFTTKPEGKGTGLGLSTVYGIVKQSGGEILVYSEPGRGTTFKVYLPIVDIETRHKKISAEVPASKGSETVLVVEDDPALLRLTAKMLGTKGYNVLTASSGSDALHIAESHAGEIDLLLTDVVMPGMSGPDLAKRLAEHRNRTKVLYMSGYTDDAVIQHGLLEENLHFLQKPFTVKSLTRKVREALESD